MENMQGPSSSMAPKPTLEVPGPLQKQRSVMDFEDEMNGGLYLPTQPKDDGILFWIVAAFESQEIHVVID